MVFWLYGTVLFFTVVAVIYLYRTRNSLRTIDDYLTARQTLSAAPAAATILASIMGAWILFSPAEAGTWGGLTAFGGYAVAQALVIALYAVFGPRMRQLAPRGTTLSEYIYYRYGKSMYIIVLFVSVFYMAVFLAAELTGIALAVYLVAGIPLWVTALLVGGGTLIYTTYGGIRGTIFTDGIQALVMIPALVLAFAGTLIYAGGFESVVSRIRYTDPSLLGIGHPGGWEFAGSLLIAVVAANLFHQGFWSRVYACKDDSTVRRSFLWAGLLVVPIVFITGSFGLMAVAEGATASPSAALFEVVLAVAPAWVISTVLVLAVVLVMSSADTLLNGMAGVFTADLARFSKELNPRRLMFFARIATAFICVAVILIASRGYSVLYLFLLADLVCAAAVFPAFYGMYCRRLPGWAAAVSALAGMAGGALLFPDPSFTRGNLLYSFAIALIIPLIISLALRRRGPEIELKVPQVSG